MQAFVSAHSTKSAALKAARLLRAQGQAIKVFHHGGVYTQPGRGLASYDRYEVVRIG